MKRNHLVVLIVCLNIIVFAFGTLTTDFAIDKGVFNDSGIEGLYFIASILFLELAIFFGVHSIRQLKKGEDRIPVWKNPLISGVFAIIIATLGFMFAGMYPFGDHNIMMVDMWGQYTPLLADLRNLIKEGGNWFYTNQVGLGTGFLPLFGYYLASPLNVLLVLFPIEYLPVGFMVITIIKIGLCAAAFTLCVQSIFKVKNVTTILTGVMYSGMFFILAYSWCIMWMDSLIMLPICVLLMERMLETKKFVAYSIAVAITVCLNFYMAFIICIFLAIYWVFWAIREERSKEEIFNGAKYFAIGSLLGGGMSAVLALPTFIGLQSTSAAGDSIPAWKSQMSLFDVSTQMLYNTSLTIRSKDMANVACGVLAIVSVPLYFFSESITKRRKLGFLFLLSILVLSFGINRLDLVWHGFHTPNDLPYRYSFIFSFIVLLMTCDLLNHAQNLSFDSIKKVGFGLIAWLMLAQVLGGDTFSFSRMYVSFALMALYLTSYCLMSVYKKDTRIIQVALLVIVVAEVWSQTSVHRYTMDSQEGYGTHSNWASAENIGRQDVVSAIHDDAQGTEFYRAEMLTMLTFQDGALYDFDGVSSYASTYYYTTTKTMKNLGFASNGINSSRYKGYMPTVDSLLGLRYVALRSDLSDYPGLTKVPADLGDSGWYLYENEESLSVGYVGTSSLESWTSTQYNPVQTQNTLYQALTGDMREVLQINSMSALSTATVNQSEVIIDGTHFVLPSKGSDVTASFEVLIEHPGHVFIYVDCGAATSVSVQGVSTWSYSQREPYFIDNSERAVGDRVQVDVTGNGVSGNIYVVSVNEDVYQQAMSTLDTRSIQVEAWEDGYLRGSFDTPIDGVMLLTIPYDTGWSIKVDGKNVPYFAVDEGLIGLQVSTGQHTIEMSYTPPGLVIGLGISAVSLVLMIGLTYMIKKEKVKW